MTHAPFRLIIPALLLFVTLAGAAEEEPPAFRPPEALGTGWYVRMETDRGRIIARLLPDQAPQTVAHFAALAEGRLEWLDPVSGETHKAPFYDGTVIDKVKAGSHFEAGEPLGASGPRLFLPREVEGPVNFGAPGRLGMVKIAGALNSAYRFFVTYGAQMRLNNRYNCFGMVIEGLDVIMELTGVKAYSNGRPLEPMAISELRIFKVGDPPPLPEPVHFTPKHEVPTLERRVTE
jgi:peptidyl-prolyl cis-trans isomerase A (cyclophilin A)